MKFNDLVKVFEDFYAPVDTKKPVKVRPKGKYGTVNPQLNEPHNSKSITGFKGQPGGKIKTLKFKLPKEKTTKKSVSKQQRPS
tara:strand:- start:3448 stop:3696 length:249 start_codon:yes stop_codon:yes gene_type:complete